MGTVEAVSGNLVAAKELREAQLLVQRPTWLRLDVMPFLPLYGGLAIEAAAFAIAGSW